jgi:hypothetical protein
MKKIYIDKRVTVIGKKNEINTANSLDLNNHITEVNEALGIIPTYKEYVATVTQSVSAAPSATVLHNTLGGTLVWTRSGTGTYLATLTGAFPTASKVVILTSFTSSDLAPAGSIALTSAVVDTANRLKFITATMDNAGARTVADSVLNISLIVRVYS